MIITNLSVFVDTQQILHNVSLEVTPGTVHALMGPNGSGKSSLAATIMGHFNYKVTTGSCVWQEVDIINLEPHERARAGIFLAVQYPPAIPGVRIKTLLIEACRAIKGAAFDPVQFELIFKEACNLLTINPVLCERGMHDGFSGGEKKRFELLQLLVLESKFIIFDEIDSGLDIDAIRLVGTVIAHIKSKNPAVSVLIITHYQRILEYVIPDCVHVLSKGRIVATGGYALVRTLEAGDMMLTNNGENTDTVSYIAQKGLSRGIVIDISVRKQEPEWMREYRLHALTIFEQKVMPAWGADLSELCIDDIHYYVSPRTDQQSSWDDVPSHIKTTFTALGIPQAEQKYLAGVGAQYESEMVYKALKQEWREQGVLFMDMSTALREHPDLFKKYFATVIPSHDNKFAALNSAVWSGGSFVYVPAGVRLTMPLQAYFRINQQSMGQFERTLIIAEPGSFVHYVEGCSAPVYQKSSLHSAVVELIALPGSHIRYTTIQNWSQNVYNLVTKRAIAHENATVEWIDGNFGSKVTMKYPCIILKGARAKGTIISLAVAGAGQVQDSGGKIIHIGAHTTSHIIAKSISKQGGRSSYRGLLKVVKGAHGARAQVQCDALLLDDKSRTDTYPTNQINESDVSIAHEASVSKISAEQLWYLQIRGFSEQKAQAFIVNGFIDSFVDQLPMEYAVEINRLINHEMAGSLG